MKLFLITAAFFVLANICYGQSPDESGDKKDVCTNGGELEKRKGTCPRFPPPPPSPSSLPPPHISHDRRVIHCKCDKECPEYMKCCKVPHRNATCMKPRWEGDMSWDKKTEEDIKKWEEKMSAQKENDDDHDCDDDDDDDDDHRHHERKDKMHSTEKKKRCHHRRRRIALIVAPVAGLVLIVGMVSLVVCCIRRRRQRSNATKRNVTFDVNNYYVSQDNEKNKDALKSALGQDFSPEVTLSALPPYRKLEEDKEQV